MQGIREAGGQSSQESKRSDLDRQAGRHGHVDALAVGARVAANAIDGDGDGAAVVAIALAGLAVALDLGASAKLSIPHVHTLQTLRSQPN